MKGPLFLILIISTAFSGCVAPAGSLGGDMIVSDHVAKSAVYPAKPRDYKERIRSYMHLTLKDPEGAQYQDWILAKAYLGSNPPVYGWLVTVDVNAKNGFGAYTGFEPEIFWLHGNDLIQPAVNLPDKVHVVQVDTAELLKNIH